MRSVVPVFVLGLLLATGCQAHSQQAPTNNSSATGFATVPPVEKSARRTTRETKTNAAPAAVSPAREFERDSRGVSRKESGPLPRFFDGAGLVVATGSFKLTDEGVSLGPNVTVFNSRKRVLGEQIRRSAPVSVLQIAPHPEAPDDQGYDQVRIRVGGTEGWVSRMQFSQITPVARNAELRDSEPDVIEKPKVDVAKLRTLEDFERSLFFKKYRCRAGKGWNLRSGGRNNTYKAAITPSVTIEVTTEQSRITGGGLTFYERSRLMRDDLDFSRSFLTAILGEEIKEETIRFVERKAETRVSQISQAQSVRVGSWEIRAGKVTQQVVSVRRVD